MHYCRQHTNRAADSTTSKAPSRIMAPACGHSDWSGRSRRHAQASGLHAAPLASEVLFLHPRPKAKSNHFTTVHSSSPRPQRSCLAASRARVLLTLSQSVCGCCPPAVPAVLAMDEHHKLAHAWSSGIARTVVELCLPKAGGRAMLTQRQGQRRPSLSRSVGGR